MSPKTVIPDAGLRLIARLEAARAADPRNWVLIKQKQDSEKKLKDDGLPDSCTILGLGETTVRLLVKSEQIESLKAGGTLLLNRDSILEWMIARVEETYGLKEKKAADGRRRVLAKGRATMVEKRNGGDGAV